MKKFLVFFFALVLVGAGCSVPQEGVYNTPMQNEKIQMIEKSLSQKEQFTYPLPKANATITKREVTGFIDADKNGKISRITEGMASTREHFYFEKGELFAVKLESASQEKTKITEMYFENKKIISFVVDGVEDMKNSNIEYLEKRELEDAQTILDDFLQRKLMSE